LSITPKSLLKREVAGKEILKDYRGGLMGGCWVWWVREENEKKICLKNANGLERLSIPIAIGIKTW